MKIDKRVICFGLGTTDPTGVFGSTINLEKIYGKERVFDVPASENSLTGMAIGSSMLGTVPILTHQRLDFSLLSLDQIINQAAKWYYTSGGLINIPITIRLITGRGWGQGPTHSQNLQSIFAHIPGLKVVMPSTIDEMPNLLLSSIFDKNPVIFIENRWLHFKTTKKKFAPKLKKLPYHKIICKGKHITILSMSYMTLEAQKASNYLKKYFGIECEVIDLLSISPINKNFISNSIIKTKNLLVVDTAQEYGSISKSILDEFSHLFYNNKPQILAMPNFPEPTSKFMTKNFYNDYTHIVKKVCKILNIKDSIQFTNSVDEHDKPTSSFKGPF
jgi:pyruvate dehydrogenase E1 component beta subunit